MRSLLFVSVLCSIASGQTLDDAVRQVAKNILAAGEVAHVSEHALAPEFAAETTRARGLLDRALRRPAPRDARTVEVVVTATENISGPLLVVQIQKGDEQFVETAAYTSQPVPHETSPKLLASFLWRQQYPILDLATIEDQMLILSPAQVLRLKRATGGWAALDSVALEAPATSRDPRGRLQVSEDSVTAYLPGETCTGTRSPSLQLTCSQNSGEFQIDGEQLHLIPGENTLETASGERLYSVAHAGDFRLSASIDGNLRGSSGQQAFSIADWGSDIVSLPARCATNPLVVSTSSTAAESLTAYQVAGANPRRMTDPLPMQGPVTALWPAADGAIAIVHEAATSQYAAYSVSIDCGN